MKIQYIAILLLICWGSILKCSAQKVAVKTNLFYGAYSGTPVSYTHLGSILDNNISKSLIPDMSSNSDDCANITNINSYKTLSHEINFLYLEARILFI